MSEEHPLAGPADEDFWDFWDRYGANNSNGPNISYDDIFDFGAEVDLAANVDATGLEAPDPNATPPDVVNGQASPDGEEQSSGNALNTSSDPVQPSVDSATSSAVGSRQQSDTTTPGTDSAYVSASASGVTTPGMIPATPAQLGSTIGFSNSDTVRELLGDENLVAHPLTDKDHLDVDSDDSDEESEKADVPNEVPYETYEEDDPLIVQDPLQPKWGRTGTRNGQEVWFNPETSKVSFSPPLHSNKLLNRVILTRKCASGVSRNLPTSPAVRKSDKRQNHRHLIMI